MSKSRKGSPPIEYSLLLTATLCLLAFGVVMVFSASSTPQLLGQSGEQRLLPEADPDLRGLGLLVMHLLARRGVQLLRPMTPLMLGTPSSSASIVMRPRGRDRGQRVAGWLGAGPVQIQPSD